MLNTMPHSSPTVVAPFTRGGRFDRAYLLPLTLYPNIGVVVVCRSGLCLGISSYSLLQVSAFCPAKGFRTFRRDVIWLGCLSRSVIEPSHSRGAPDVPQPLTLGDQYLTRYNTLKKCVRATRPALVCASPQTNI